MCAVEIAQQRHCERRVLKHHGHDARCIVVGRARPRSHTSAAVLGCNGRERERRVLGEELLGDVGCHGDHVKGPRANARSPFAGKIMSVMTDALQCSAPILRPEEITFAMIEDRELFPRPLRSVLIERFGTERFIEEAKQRGLVRVVHVGREGRYGKGSNWLLADFAAVEVENATVEPAGKCPAQPTAARSMLGSEGTAIRCRGRAPLVQCADVGADSARAGRVNAIAA